MGAPDVGITDVSLTEAGLRDPLFSGLGEALPMLQWHGVEVQSLPRESETLACSSACGVEAFRYGDRAYGNPGACRGDTGHGRRVGANPGLREGARGDSRNWSPSRVQGPLRRLDAVLRAHPRPRYSKDSCAWFKRRRGWTFRNHPTHPRSTVWAENGMAASSHPAASLAAIDILREGGSAMDAAVAAHLVLGVVEPMSTGIGGDAFCLYAPGGAGEPVAFNGSGRAPAGLTADHLLSQRIRAIEADSVHSVTIPGAVDAFLRLLADYGRLAPERVFAPAIRFAEEGFPVSPVIAWSWGLAAPRLRQKPESAATYLPGGSAPRAGSRFRHPRLAAALRAIRDHGREAFYEGLDRGGSRPLAWGAWRHPFHVGFRRARGRVCCAHLDGNCGLQSIRVPAERTGHCCAPDDEHPEGSGSWLHGSPWSGAPAPDPGSRTSRLP